MDAGEPQLCLVVDAAGGATAVSRCQQALSASAVATIIISSPVDGKIDPSIAKEIIALAHQSGIAALIQNDPDLARKLGADGVHLTWSRDALQAYSAARALLGATAIIGADAGHSRHEAMSLGESGADYVGFGMPREIKERDIAAARQIELVEWWAEIFEIPVVAFDVDDPEHAADLAEAGADFVAARIPPGLPIDHIPAWTAAIVGAFDARLIAS